MKKNKFFGLLASSVLLLNVASPSITAIAESQLGETLKEELEKENNSEIRLVFEGIEESSKEIPLYININDGKILLTGESLHLFNVEVKNEDAEQVITIDENNPSVNLEEHLNSQLVVSHEGTVIFESKFVDLLSNEGDTYSPESDETINENDTSEIEESVEQPKEENLPVESEEASSSNEDAPIPASHYVVDDYINEDDVALPRSTEIEEMLFGNNSSTALQSRMFVMSTSSSRTHVNGIYTVVSGDTFNSIARSFNLSTRQLQEWNRHVSNTSSLVVGTRLAVNRRGVESMLSSTDRARLFTGGTTPAFSTRQEFIDEIAPRAIRIANQSGEEALYPSLMIAQAAHESNFGLSSLASPPFHNLSGIKGTHNGESTLMWTWEVLGGVRVDVLARFRKYPSFDASLQDYANLMRRGLSWDRNYYAGTWRSRTTSVWDVLDNGGLRGYATDPNYFAAIRRIINQFDLTRFDTGNFYVRTGTFLGKASTQQRVNQLRAANGSFSYRIERENNMTPFSYRRIESTREFIGEAGAQRVIDQLQRERGWSASMVATGNSTQRHRVRSGFFNTQERAERALREFTSSSGFAARIERGSDGKYRIRTGFFNGYASAQDGLAAMQALGWAAIIQESTDSTPHYTVRTGTFNTPNHVNRAESYFAANGWGSRQIMSSQNNYFYRIFIEGFIYEDQATAYVSHLRNNYNWGSTAFPVH